MPLWPLISPVVKYALTNVDFLALYGRLSSLQTPRLPQTRAYVVSALNAALPLERATWTPQSLFLFIAGFAKVERAPNGEHSIVWIHEPQTVAQRILRGITPGASDELRGLLLDECGEVFETLQAIAPQARSLAVPAGPKVYERALNRYVEERDRLRDRKIAALLATALLGGGLSTNECRALLLAHGISSKDVDRVLRSA